MSKKGTAANWNDGFVRKNNPEQNWCWGVPPSHLQCARARGSSLCCEHRKLAKITEGAFDSKYHRKIHIADLHTPHLNEIHCRHTQKAGGGDRELWKRRIHGETGNV